MDRNWMSASWKMLMLRGAIALVFGVVAMVWPSTTALTFVFLWGIWALADGFGSLLQAFQPESKGRARVLLILMGVIALLAGAFAVTSPSMAAATLTWILGIWLLIRGVFELVGAFASSTVVPRGLLILGAILDLVLGVLFVANPGKGAAGIAFVLGLAAFAWGVVFVAVGFWVRREAADLDNATSSA